MFVQTENDTESHRNIKNIGLKYNTITNLHLQYYMCENQQKIYVQEPTGRNKKVVDNYVIFLIIFLIQPFTNQLIWLL